MRTVSYAVAMSVDGYIADRTAAMDWLRWSEDASRINAAAWAGVDTILMGRKTFDFGRRSGGIVGTHDTYIFSRTLDQSPEGTRVVNGDAVGFVRDIKSAEGGGIILMGGGEVASALIDGGVVDEIALNIHSLVWRGHSADRPSCRLVGAGAGAGGEPRPSVALLVCAILAAQQC